jgi:redox-sensitive bicupin YhaK (pirin superfamily)
MPSEHKNFAHMKTVIHKADSRGSANYGWLKTFYSFSFANYYDPNRIHFGTLRVLNDDYIEGGHGFDRHPHDNMEIITIMLEGELKHEDSMGNSFVLHENEIQTMSAGTGIFHSEANNDPEKSAKLLQIWVFPKQRNIQPSYGLAVFSPEERKNKWHLVVSPSKPGTAQIHQNAFFSMISMEESLAIDYQLYNSENGVYTFVIDGEVEVGGLGLNKRDGIGVWETESIPFKAKKKAEVLVMEIPMK